jgi:hypothetical protein
VYQRSSVWGICTALKEQLLSSFGEYMRLRKLAAVLGQHFCSVRENVHQRKALTVIRNFASTRASIPKNSLNQASFQSHKDLSTTKSLMFEYKETCTQSDRHENLYSRLPQTQFHVRWWSLTKASTFALIIGSMRT